MTTKIEKVNPSLELVFVDRLFLHNRDQEKTIVRFTLSGDGKVVGMNRNPKVLTPYALES